MKLSFLQRMVIMQLLPETGSFITVKAMRKLREALAPSEKEFKRLAVTENKESGEITWDASKDKNVDIEVGEIMFEVIKKRLKELDEKEELTPQHESIYSMFVN